MSTQFSSVLGYHTQSIKHELFFYPLNLFSHDIFYIMMTKFLSLIIHAYYSRPSIRKKYHILHYLNFENFHVSWITKWYVFSVICDFPVFSWFLIYWTFILMKKKKFK